MAVTLASHIDHSVSRAQQRELKLKLSVQGGKKNNDLEALGFFWSLTFLCLFIFVPQSF